MVWANQPGRTQGGLMFVFKRALPATLLLFGGVLAACGSSNNASSTSQTSASTTATAPKQLTNITMVEAVSAPAYAPVTLAKSAGFFKKNGLNVTVIPLQAGSTAAEAMVAGSAQFDAGVASDALLADSKGLDLISIASLTNSINLDIEINKTYADAHGITPTESLNSRLLALKGAKIGITAPGSITDLAVRYMLASVGLKAVTDYHEVAVGSPAANLTALKADAIQATIFDPSYSELATQQGVGILGIQAAEFPVLKDAAFGAIITSKKYAQANPQIVKEVATSFAETNNFILDHPNQSLADIEKLYPSISPPIM
ncbi:MAG: ABC transporter substrate-binding protein, partial [Actinomycetota bacterium]